MTDEERKALVERLREQAWTISHMEAADQRIAELELQNATMRANMIAWADQSGEQEHHIAELEARVDGLKQERDFHRRSADLHCERIAELEAEVEKFSGLAKLAILNAYDTDKFSTQRIAELEADEKALFAGQKAATKIIEADMDKIAELKAKLAVAETQLECANEALRGVIECDPGSYEATIARAAIRNMA